jgi:hypothetical protein
MRFVNNGRKGRQLRNSCREGGREVVGRRGGRDERE